MGKTIDNNRGVQSVCGMDKEELDNFAHDMVHFAEQRERIYHYTSMNTFFKILEDAKDDHFIFRAGSLYTMNDRQEMVLGYENIKKYLPKVEEKLRVKDDEKIFNMTKDQQGNRKIQNEFGEWLKNDDITNFIVSFSKAPDILPMWALYGERGTGVCMEFSPYIINKYYKDNDIDIKKEIEDCKYSPKEIKDFLLWRLETIYKQYFEEEKEVRGKPLTKASYLVTMCCIAGAFVKHPAFKYEQEVRMNVFMHKKHWKFDEKSHKPYVEIPIPLHALTDVIVGPAANLDLINSMFLCLRAKGLSIEPKQSEIPFKL